MKKGILFLIISPASISPFRTCTMSMGRSNAVLKSFRYMSGIVTSSGIYSNSPAWASNADHTGKTDLGTLVSSPATSTVLIANPNEDSQKYGIQQILYQEAMETLYSQRLASEDIKNVIKEGKLEEARFKLSNLVLVVKSTGGTILNVLKKVSRDYSRNDSMELMERQFQLERLLGLYRDIGYLIEDGLRSQTPAVTQLQTLDKLKEAEDVFDQYLKIGSIFNLP